MTKPTKIKKSRKGNKSHVLKPTSSLYLDKAAYKDAIHGLMAQGIDHDDAVLTLKIGLREANGLPIPLELIAGQTKNNE